MADSIRDKIKRTVGTQKAWAEATGQNIEHVSRIVTGKYPVPEWWLAILEFLETTAPADRPKRWSARLSGR